MAVAPTVSLSASPASVVVGSASTLTWSSTNATSCTASNGWTGARPVSGTESVTPASAGTVTYTLTCTGAGGSGSATSAVTATPPVVAAKGSISGRVVDTSTGAAIAGASVTAGGVSGVTDGNGEFAIADVPVSDRAQVVVSATGFESSFRIAPVTEGQTTMVSVLAVPVGVSMMVTPSTGGDVQVSGSPAMARFPPGSIASDSPVMVTVTDLNPASSPENMPGDYTTMSGGTERQIESFGALTVNIRDSAGTQVSLRDGSMATLRIPLSTRNASPMTSIPLWFYDTNTGRWVEQGTATLVRSPDGDYYEGAVPHFTTWNADFAYSSVNLTGCVEDGGQPVSGVTVTSTGADYTGTSSAVTGADGRFTIRVRPNSRVTLNGRLLGDVTSTNEVMSTSQDQDITSSCLTFARSSSPLSIRLTWGNNPLDLDSRIYLPEGGEVSYEDEGSLETEPFVALDVDDTTSFGPEVITVLRPKVGTYRYYVNNYSETFSPGITESPARVELTANGMLQVFVPPAGETASTYNWTVFDITVAANCNATVTLATAPWTADFPARPSQPNSAAAFCTP
ncbi:MAG: carboxypeptidase regulatory-like domain-containing protein [Pseudomonadota bacterium]